MGGSGGGGGRVINPRALETLGEIAKKTIKEVGSDRPNVFLSFVNEDLGDINLFRGQAKNENLDLEFNDWSVKEPFDSKDADYLKRGIRERIRQSSAVIVYVSDKTSSSDWVNWEVRESLALGKIVVAVYKGQSPPSKLPQAVKDNKVKVIPWDQQAIMKLIRGNR